MLITSVGLLRLDRDPLPHSRSDVRALAPFGEGSGLRRQTPRRICHLRTGGLSSPRRLGLLKSPILRLLGAHPLDIPALRNCVEFEPSTINSHFQISAIGAPSPVHSYALSLHSERVPSCHPQ